MKKFKTIMIIDDNPDDNFFHQRVITKNQLAEKVITEESPEKALEFLKGLKLEERPDLIFLDINMPRMNGWEFMEEYKKSVTTSPPPLVLLLTTSSSEMDKAKSQSEKTILDFKTKPLTKEMVEEIWLKYKGYLEE